MELPGDYFDNDAIEQMIAEDNTQIIRRWMEETMPQTRIGVVVRDWKALKALPDDARVKAWGWPETAGRVKASMRERLHLKISSRIVWYDRGRKWTDTYQTEQLRDCWRIRDKVTKRIRLYQIMTPELLRRYQHLLDDRTEI